MEAFRQTLLDGGGWRALGRALGWLPALVGDFGTGPPPRWRPARRKLLGPLRNHSGARKLTTGLHGELNLISTDLSLVGKRHAGFLYFHHKRDRVTCNLAIADLDGRALGCLPGAR